MDLQIYNSKDLHFKKPYGAVPSGTQVRFTLRPLRMEGFSRGVLRARFEFRDNEEVEVPLLWEDVERERDAFTAVLDTADYVGLVWYTFRLEGLDGRTRAMAAISGSSGIALFTGMT